MMNLNSCNTEEFLCNNGECIPMSMRCNIEKDCIDESDEQNCNIVTLARGYNRKIPPATRRGGGNNSGLGEASVEVVVQAFVYQISSKVYT